MAKKKKSQTAKDLFLISQKIDALGDLFGDIPADANEYPYSVYFSAACRGPKGDRATKADKEFYIQQAIARAQSLKAKYPHWRIHVPHEQETFVEKAWEMGEMDSAAIMRVFCALVAERELLVVAEDDTFDNNGNVVSNGVLLEIAAARENKIPIISYTNAMGLS